MDQPNQKILKSLTRGSPIVITWFDAYDDSNEEITLGSTLENTETLYDTIGFYIGISGKYVTIGYNKDLDPKMPQAYRGIGRIPISIINAVRLLDDPQEN